MNNLLSIRNGGNNGGGNHGNHGNHGSHGNYGNYGDGVGEDVIDVGAPRHPAGWSTTLVRYHDFARLPRRRGLDHVDSPPFRSHGLDWYLRVHPGGAASSSGDDCVSLYLRCKTACDRNVPVMAEFSLSLRGRDGRVDSAMSCPRNAFRRKRKGWPNFGARPAIPRGGRRPSSGITTSRGCPADGASITSTAPPSDPTVSTGTCASTRGGRHRRRVTIASPSTCGARPRAIGTCR